MAMPTRDAALVAFSTNFNDRIVASPGDYGTTAAAAAQYTALHDPYIAAVSACNVARAAGVRTGPLWQTRNSARLGLLRYGRELYKTIQSSITVTNTAKMELGIVIPDVEPTPVSQPTVAPGISVVSVNGRVVNVRVFNAQDDSSNARPAGVVGGIVLSWIGETPPADPRAYKMEGPIARTRASVAFPIDTAPGTKVWLTAVWFNQRKQMGPAAAPVATLINYGGEMPMVG